MRDQSNSVNPVLAGSLFYYHRARNEAIGINRDNHFADTLRRYADYLLRQRVFELTMTIAACRTQINKLIDEADSEVKQRRALVQCLRLRRDLEAAIAEKGVLGG